MKKLKLAILIIFLPLQFVLAQEQFTLQGEYRLNPLYSRGFRVPLQNDAQPEFYVHQRSRLIFKYDNPNNLSSELIFQDRRAWGTYNNNGAAGILSIFRAWVEKSFTENFSVRLGRQGFIYDDQYLLGGLNWGGNMAHDAALLKFEKNGWQIHSALSYNANGFDLSREEFEFKNHKHMQFVWVHKELGKVSASAIALNRGLEKPDGSLRTRSNQTVGANVGLKLTDQVSLKGIYYHQFGKDTVGEQANKVNAFMYSAQLTFKPSKFASFTIGTDVMSGADQADLQNPAYTEKNNFDILFGLRHGHFGYLDYFYLKLWPETGLEDYYLKSKFKFSDKVNLDAHWHTFLSHGEIQSNEIPGEVLESSYGSELDLKLNYKHDSSFKATLGYSKMWLTDTYMSYYGDQQPEGSSAIYAVLTFKPTFIKK